MTDRYVPIITEETFNRSIPEVWAAITQLDQMVQWFFEGIPEFEARVGFETHFNVNAGERDFMHVWKIIELEPGRKIVYDWSYEKHDGRGEVSMELFEQGNQTTLRLINIGLDTFPDLPEFTRQSCIGGWDYFINQRLKEYLDR